MPTAWAQTWTATDRVGYEGSQVLEQGALLELLVEKDFQSLHKRPDEADAFPYPLVDEPEVRP